MARAPASAGFDRLLGRRMPNKNIVETRKVNPSMINAVWMPKMPVVTPPIAAPRASITDQVEAPRAFAVPSSCGDVMSGRIALRAGLKKPLIAKRSVVSV